MRISDWSSDVCSSDLPVAVEPVKLILSKPVWPVIQGPSASPPLTILSTPGGSRSFTSSPNLRVESGVNGEGLSTIVLPASSAGPTLNIASSSGKFHGEIEIGRAHVLTPVTNAHIVC